MRVSENIKALKAKRRLTNIKLAELAGIPVRTLEEVIRRGDCRVSTGIKIAEALGVTIAELCNGKELK